MASESGTTLRDGLSTVTRGTLFLLVSTLFLIGLTFVWRVLLIRSLSPADWNAFSFGLALAGVLSAFGTLGLPTAVARSIPYASTEAERRTIVRGSLLIGGVAALATSVVLWAVADPIGQALGIPAIGYGLEFFAIAVGSSILSTIIASVFQGFEDVFPNAFFIQVITPALFVVFLTMAVGVPPFGISYPEALIAYSAANGLTLVLLVVYALRRLPRRLPRGPQAPEALGRLLRFATPLFVVTIMSSVIGSGDTLVLGVFHSSEVGTYTASLTLARLLQIGIGALGYIFLPVATRFLREDQGGSIPVTYATVTKWMILFSLPLFFLFFFLPGASLTLVYSKYSSIVLPLQIAVLGAFITTVLGPSNTTQVAYGQTRLLMINAVIAGVVDIALSLALAPSYGYAGAAVAWGGANVTYTGLSLGQIAHRDGVHPFRRDFVLPLLVTAIPVGAALALLHPVLSLLMLPVLGIAIALWFLVVLLLTRSIDEGDRLLLEAVERLLGRRLGLVRRIGRYGLRRNGGRGPG